MAITLVQVFSDRGSGGFTPTLTPASPTTAGNLLVAWFTKRGGGLGTVQETIQNDDFVLIGNEMDATNNNRGRFGWCVTGGNSVFQFTTTNSTQVTIWELSRPGGWTGWDPATDAVIYEQTATTSGTFSVGAIAESSAPGNYIMIGAVIRSGFDGTVDVTPGTGWVEDRNLGITDTGVDDEPTHWAAHWNQSTNPLTGSGTLASHTHAGAAISVIGDAPVDCESPVEFDVYSLGDATTPALTYLATLCDAFDKSFRVELDGTGSGKFSINRSSSDATAAILGDGDGDVRYIKVRIPDIDADPIFGFFIEQGDFRLLDSDEEGGETLTFQGHGALAYLDFARMLAHSYITGGMDPYTGLWRLYLAGTGSKPGQMLGRIIEEAQDADRPQAPLPLLTDTFDYTNDSNAAAWASSDATNEFSAQIGESLLSVAGRLIGTGAITIQMSPDFVLSAYNSFGTDRSNTTFAAGKVRFVGATNIAEGLTRQIRPSRVATHDLVYGESEASAIASLADAASRVTREAYVSATGTTATALEAIGDADLAERQLRSESLSVRIALGSDEASGLYLPGPSGSSGHFWVGDTVTLHTGTGEFDYDNVAFRVAAINVIEGPAVAAVTDLEVVVELGSTQMIDGSSSGTTTVSASPGGGSSAVPPHTHPSAAAISAWKEPVRAASTGNVTVASPGASIDGVTLAAQNRVLLKDQSTGSQNGIYVWLGAATAMVRAPDFASGTTALGAVVYATEGTVNADRAFVCTTNATITLGTTALTFVPSALLPHGGGEDTVYAHGNMGATETFDPANGNWHTATFDANCTFTLTAPRSGKGCTIFLELAQDGTGGWTLTLPASVTNKTELEAAQVTTASTTSFLMLWTRDGGTTWYGGWVGGAALASPLTTKGDLWGYDTADARVPVGTDGYLLVADSTDAQGIVWENPEATGHWEVLMDGSSPPEPLENGSGTDWLYVWVP